MGFWVDDEVPIIPIKILTPFWNRIPTGTHRERRFHIVMFILVPFLAILDQITKEIAVRHLSYGESVSVIPGFFNFVHVLNFGAAFGQFQQMGSLLLTISAIVFIGIIVWLRKWTEGCPERFIALALILSGIIGNCFDRLFRDPAAVVDFLDFYIGSYHWPAFNVADSCICVGAGLFILSNLIRKSTN